MVHQVGFIYKMLVGHQYSSAKVQNVISQSLTESSLLCMLELSRLTRIEKAVKNTTIIVIYRVLVYI